MLSEVFSYRVRPQHNVHREEPMDAVLHDPRRSAAETGLHYAEAAPLIYPGKSVE
jgi:hypothetical protein